MKSKLILSLIILGIISFSCKEKKHLNDKPNVNVNPNESNTMDFEKSNLKNHKRIELEKMNLGEDISEINCYVKNIYRKDDLILVDIDVVQVILTPEGKRTIINENSKIRTYVVDENTIIYSLSCETIQTPEKLLELDESSLNDKSIIVIGSSENGILKSLNFGCYG